ncbi:nitroreductase family protein [Desulfurispira natronophila]|uniref:Nitroreductase n=1 Tax=Desulfurispira natronophila TaxID=682562 RepID=A0A7W8DFY3_9BACT|nr:nitroreductase family protein [Desulfurispira natronophila]MBB5020911.1 nitroreductase [Desulfurispira natronophila]
MFMEMIRKRRSIRQFTDQPIAKETQNLVIEAALRAPSSRSRQPWEYYIVDNPDIMDKLSLSKPHGSAFVAEATFVIVIAADPTKCDVWIEDTSVAATYIQLAAESLGLGSTWVQLRQRPHDDLYSASQWVQQLLDIPSHLEVPCFIAMGYPNQVLPAWKESDLEYSKVHRIP